MVQSLSQGRQITDKKIDCHDIWQIEISVFNKSVTPLFIGNEAVREL